jgi:hypothetical protein
VSGVRSLEAPEVQALALDMVERGALQPWPEEAARRLGVPEYVCAMVQVEGSLVAVMFNSNHQCTRPERVMLHAAALVLDYKEQGPDEGWNAVADGGHLTMISEPGPMAKNPNVVIPVCELPPL